MGTLLRPLTAIAIAALLPASLPATAGSWSDDDVAAAERYRELERERAERYRAELPDRSASPETRVGPGQRRADDRTTSAERPSDRRLAKWIEWLGEEFARAVLGPPRGPAPAPDRPARSRREPSEPKPSDARPEWLARLERAFIALLSVESGGEAEDRSDAGWRDAGARLRLAWIDARAFLDELREREAQERELHFYEQLD